MEQQTAKLFLLVRQQAPLVLNLTNYVVMNNTANALLAAGASPIMAHARAEISDMVTIASAVVINIGTLDEYWSECMLTAAAAARAAGKPWVLDPVGAGASRFRNEVLSRLLEHRPSIIRGNASEILALAGSNTTATKGVDSTASSNEALESALALAKQYECVVCVSGATDIITDGTQVLYGHNGHPMMTKITGLGCSASALIGAFAGVTKDYLSAAAAAVSLLSIAGEIAAEHSSGPGSLQVRLLDILYTIGEADFLERLKLSTHAS